jgi:cytochrome c biogenesis protein CcmG/thiol:disulfide interchange protein DsbE
VAFVALPCAVLALAVLALWPAGRPASELFAAGNAGVVPVAQDRPAPDFSEPLVGGAGTLSLRQFRGNVVVVNFWASWCTACRNEAPQLRALARRQRGVVFLGVDEQDTRSGGEGFIRQFGLGYRSVFDPDGSLLRAFGSIGVPSTFIVDRSGRIQYQALGAFDPKAFTRVLAGAVA